MKISILNIECCESLTDLMKFSQYEHSLEKHFKPLYVV